MISNLEIRLEQELGVQLYDQYRQGILGRKPKRFCDTCIEVQKARGWYGHIDCDRSTDEMADKLLGHLPEGQRALAEQAIDPVTWATQELKWEARWYQSQAMRCTAQWQCHRWGRRTGKTNFLGIVALHLAATKPGMGLEDPFTTLVVTPYQDQLEKIFQYMRDALAKSDTLCPSRDIRDPQLIEFPNGGKIIGFTAGEKTGARSEKIRGQDANAIIIDEADRIRSDDIDAVMAILASHADCKLFFSTTPTGLPTRFKAGCEKPELGYKEFWFTSFESPEYTDKTDTQLKMTYPTTTYEHEILAVFGAAEGGVFLPAHMKTALKDYPLDQPLLPEELAIMGIDCNDPRNGTHAVLMAVNNETQVARMLAKEVLHGEDFSKPKSLDMLRRLFLKWHPSLVAFDKGYSHGQYDDLNEWGILHPDSGMCQALRYYDLGSNYVFFDPISGVEMKRPMKPLMVGISQAFLNTGQLILPKCEDHESGVAGQMRHFHIKRIGQDGRPIYSQGYEHTLTAMMIALLSWRLEILGFEPMSNAVAMIKSTATQLPDSLPIPIGQRTGQRADDGKGLLSQSIAMRRTEPVRRQLDQPSTARQTRENRVTRKHF